MQTKHPCLGMFPGSGTATRRMKSLAAFVDGLYCDVVFGYWPLLVISVLVPS